MGLGQRYRQGCRAIIGVLIGAVCLPIWALGLQEVELISRLNQPVQFSLEVLQDSKTLVSARYLQVSIASASVYRQRGLSYSALLEDISLTVVEGDVLLIQGRSTQPLRDPVLYLLFDLQWPGGNAFVQRSVIVDLPEQYLPKSLPSNNAVTQPLPVKQPLTTKIKSNESVGERSHRVRRGEVLSLIASEYRGTVDIPLHRYMRAIQRYNREAFPEGLDQLSPGQTIRMPDPYKLLGDVSVVLPKHGQAPFIDYEVQYGDKLSLLAQHFRGNADMPLKTYMQQIVDANAGVLDMSGASLKSGMVLRIPNPMLAVSGLVSPLPMAPPEEIKQLETQLMEIVAEPEPKSAPISVPVNTDINAYKDAVEAVAEPVPAIAEPLAFAEPIVEPPMEAVVEPAAQSVKKKAKENPLRQWIMYVLIGVLLFVVGAVIIAVIRGIKKNIDPVEATILPSLLPEPEQPTEDLLDHDSMQDSIALLDVEADEAADEPEHQATLRMHANDYMKNIEAEGAEKFSNAEQDEVAKLIAQEDLAEAAKKVDQLIYSQSGDLKNWLLKLEVLAKQGKKERCYTLATQVRGSFKSAAQQAEVDSILNSYFSGPVDAAGFVPEEYSPESPRKKNAAAELASETAEVRVYLSYGFYDMAAQALNKLMQDFPRHMELRILNLEVLLGLGNVDELKRLSGEMLNGNAPLNQTQEYQVQEILERVEDDIADKPAPTMDLDLSATSSNKDASAVGFIDLGLSIDEIEHLDDGLDLEGDIADALHRQEDVDHQADDLDAEPEIDIDLTDADEIILDKLDD